MGGRGASYAKASGGGGGGVKIIPNSEFKMNGSEKQVKWAKDIRQQYIEEVREYEKSKELGKRSITGYPEHINNLINEASSNQVLLMQKKDFGERISNIRAKVHDKYTQRYEKISKMKQGPEKKQARKKFNDDLYRDLKKNTTPVLHDIMNLNDASFWIRVKKSERQDHHAGTYYVGGIR